MIDISAPGNPKVLSEVDCGAFQGDVGVYGDLVFRSVDAPVTAQTAQNTCANDSLDVIAPEGGFEGIQIFKVDDPANASAADLVTVVGTDCGSHTHTVVPDPANNRVLIYVSSSAPGPCTGRPSSATSARPNTGSSRSWRCRSTTRPPRR